MAFDVAWLRSELGEYVALITEIRVLSAVSMDETSGPDAYSRKLRVDFSKIGALGIRCREILGETLSPLLHGEASMDADTRQVLQDFCHMLLEPASGEELDLFLLFEISHRLCREFREAGDHSGYAKQLNMHISVCYANVNRTARLTVSREIVSSYQSEGLKAARALLGYLEKEKFLALTNEARKCVLNGTRFYSALYDTFYSEPETNAIRYQALVDAVRIYEDPFYRENVEDYNWERYYIRCLEHMGQLTERGNRWQFSPEQCGDICGWLEKLTALWEKDPVGAGAIIPEAHYRLILHRNAWFAGRMDKRAYQDGLLKLYDAFVNEKYDMYSVQINLLIPAEYLSSLKGERISARTESMLRRIYDRVIEYVLGSVNMDAFNYLQEYLIGFLEEFIEIPGVMSFEDMGLHCLAALHPPTYVHSLQVADISKCLCEYLVEQQPQLFVGEYPYRTSEEVREHQPQIVEHVYHSALCHDFGKIAMIDSIFIYGRNLLDREFEIIKRHTLMGAAMLGRYSSTRSYASVAKQHHVWYDQTRGYTLDERDSPLVAANIVEVADCIDAATDGIGRSYNKGKSVDELREELFRDSGTRYAPYVVDLLRDKDVMEDIHYFLKEGRQNNYRKTYLLLNGVKDRLDS